jgi:hypothetical protein
LITLLIRPRNVISRPYAIRTLKAFILIALYCTGLLNDFPGRINVGQGEYELGLDLFYSSPA